MLQRGILQRCQAVAGRCAVQAMDLVWHGDMLMYSMQHTSSHPAGLTGCHRLFCTVQAVKFMGHEDMLMYSTQRAQIVLTVVGPLSVPRRMVQLFCILSQVLHFTPALLHAAFSMLK